MCARCSKCPYYDTQCRFIVSIVSKYTAVFQNVFHCHVGGTVVQWLPQLPHSKKVLGLNLYLHESRHAGWVSLCASSGIDLYRWMDGCYDGFCFLFVFCSSVGLQAARMRLEQSTKLLQHHVYHFPFKTSGESTVTHLCIILCYFYFKYLIFILRST